jgi:Flp pilus assembly protein TadD
MATKRKNRKAKPKRRKRVGAAVHQINTRRIYQRAFDAFYEDDDPDQALALLQRIDAQGHMSIETMALYLDVLHELRDFDHYARIATVMAERLPEDPQANMLAASGAYATMQPVSAILFFERCLELAPEHPGTYIAEKELAKLRSHLPEILDAFVDELPKDLPRLSSVEKILHVFKLGRFDDVIKRAEQHLQNYPADLRIRNNLAEAMALNGDPKPALKIIDETLALAPDNFFARAVRCRLMYFQGDAGQSSADAEKLMNLKPRQISDLTKAAQSFAYIGAEDKIHWPLGEAERQGWLDDSPTDAALLMNYSATSLARAGDTKSARRLWTRAVKLAGEATTAQENLDDLHQPSGERWGAAYFGLRDWLSPQQQDETLSIGDWANRFDEDGAESDQVGEAIVRAAHRFLQKHPDVERSIPDMLDRGDAASQQFTLMIARGSQLREVNEALLDYVAGPRGTDQIRYHLLMTFKEQGHPFESPISIYVKGDVQQIEMLSFEITDEPSVPAGRTDDTCRLIEDANIALHDGNGAEAERLLRQVQQIEPEQPDVLNNLAAALEMQNRMDEADRLTDEVINNHPNYFFGKIAAANRKLTQNQFDAAHDILIDLQRRERLHFTEFFALAKSMVYTNVGQRQYAGAQHWIDMLADYAPDHPDIPMLENHLASHQRPGKVLKRIFARS